jgi:hypothetical protein
VNGFEPSTFTLATGSATPTNPGGDRDLDDEPTAGAAHAQRDADAARQLLALAESWPALPEDVRAAILALVGRFVGMGPR